MADEKPSGTNWLLGLDRLTSPTLDLLGLKLRDKVRVYMNDKAKERAILRMAEKEFLYRHVGLVGYGIDQYAGLLDKLGTSILEKHFQTISPLIKHAITTSKITPERAFECIIMGHEQKLATGFNSGELILYTLAGGVVDMLIAIHTAKTMFQFSGVPAVSHGENPLITDDELDAIMQNEETLAKIGDQISIYDCDMTIRFGKALCEAYGFEWNESEFRAIQRESNA